MNRKSNVLTMYSQKHNQKKHETLEEEILPDELLNKFKYVVSGVIVGSVFTFLSILFLY